MIYVFMHPVMFNHSLKQSQMLKADFGDTCYECTENMINLAMKARMVTFLGN